MKINIKTMNLFSIALALITALSLTACGNGNSESEGGGAGPISSLPPVGVVASDGVVSQARAMITINSESPNLVQYLFKKLLPSAYAVGGQQAVVIVNAPSASITIDTSQWQIPTITNGVLNLGNLGISSLFDNDLKVCGNNSNQKCNNAVIRVYTTGVAGAGVWNAADEYGMPITAALVNTNPTGNVGLNIAGAVTVQTQAIAGNAKVFRQSNFATAPNYNIKTDFTEAGAGSYSTTLVVDYGLSL